MSQTIGCKQQYVMANFLCANFVLLQETGTEAGKNRVHRRHDTAPLLPTSPGPASNCGLISATTHAPARTKEKGRSDLETALQFFGVIEKR